MLSGLVYCGHCGTELASTTRNHVRRYRHRGAKGDCPEIWVEAEELEAAIVARVAGLWCDAAQARIQAAITAILNGIPDARAAQAGIQEAETQLNRLIDLYLAGHLTRTEYLTRSQQIEHQIETLQAMRQAPAVAALDEAATRLCALCAELPALSMRQQREQLLAAFERITVRGGAPATFTPQPWLVPVWQFLDAAP